MSDTRIVLFPFARRRGLILKLVAKVAAQPVNVAEKYLQQEIRRQINSLHRKRLPDRVVEREVRSLESAIRAELWGLVATPSLTGQVPR